MIVVTLFSRVGCKLCDLVEADLKALQDSIPHQLKVIDIESEASLWDAYALEIPVVEVGSIKLKAPFTRQDLMMTLNAAATQVI